jgi:hypothetical protein
MKKSKAPKTMELKTISTQLMRTSENNVLLLRMLLGITNIKGTVSPRLQDNLQRNACASHAATHVPSMCVQKNTFLKGTRSRQMKET